MDTLVVCCISLKHGSAGIKLYSRTSISFFCQGVPHPLMHSCLLLSSALAMLGRVRWRLSMRCCPLEMHQKRSLTGSLRSVPVVKAKWREQTEPFSLSVNASKAVPTMCLLLPVQSSSLLKKQSTAEREGRQCGRSRCVSCLMAAKKVPSRTECSNLKVVSLEFTTQKDSWEVSIFILKP